jgi:hypothetical protein
MKLDLSKFNLDDVNANVHSVLQDFGWEMAIPEGMEEHGAYQNAAGGHCMTCTRELGENTVTLVDERGVIGLWCNGQCLADMQAISFLTEVMDAIVSRHER